MEFLDLGQSYGRREIIGADEAVVVGHVDISCDVSEWKKERGKWRNELVVLVAVK